MCSSHSRIKKTEGVTSYRKYEKEFHQFIVSSPPGIRGGMIFVSSARQGGQLLNFKSQGGDTFRGEDDFRQSSRGELLYHDELLVFPQNASP